MNDIKDHSQNMSKSTHHGKTTKLVYGASVERLTYCYMSHTFFFAYNILHNIY